jgi:hypothetical protein
MFYLGMFRDNIYKVKSYRNSYQLNAISKPESFQNSAKSSKFNSSSLPTTVVFHSWYFVDLDGFSMPR